MKQYRNVASDETVILCPDPNCNLFTKPNCIIPCEYDCPHKDKLKKIVKCPCGELVVLDVDSSPLQRVDHQCGSGRIGSTFARGTVKYHRVFEMPVKT